jgi:hypothetical protein
VYTFRFLSSRLPSTSIDTDLRYEVPFPEGYGATVHFFWPGKGFQLLGMLVCFTSPHESTTRLEQALKRKALRDLSPAWELRVPIIVLSRGLLIQRNLRLVSA